MKKNKAIIVAIVSILILIITVLAIVKIIGIKAEEVSNNSNGLQAIRTISMQSDGYAEENGEPGSWHLDKSADWTAIDKARISFDLKSIMKTEDGNYKDVILTLDMTGSMIGEKLAKLQSDSIELIDYLLSDSNNRVALIVFNNNAETVTGFTNNKDELIEKISSLAANGATNYNDPLKHVDSVMKNYIKQSNREVVTLFLTDGYPNVDTPNQVGTYQMLKNKYPYMVINGVQYEMGAVMTKEIEDISDIQWIASMETLNNVLFEAIVEPIKYEKFEVEDLINNEYFFVGTVDDIQVTNGTVNLVEENGVQKVIWSLNNFRTGIEAHMYINVNLKEEYKYQEGFYPTNKGTTVTNKEENEDEEEENTTDTPVLRMQEYEVIYHANQPEGKSVTGVPENERYHPFDSVLKSPTEPICDGWNFKGWQIVENVENLNDYTFIMPTNNVNIKAIWGKQEISKSMEGTIAEIALPKVGDTVYYSPSGTYSWSGTYSTANTTTNTTLNSGVGGSFRITEWRVLSVDETTKNIEIVPKTATSSTRNVTLQGAQGYNNAVYLLNNACKSLYSDSSKGITARSIAEEDFIKAGKKVYSSDTEATNAWTRKRASFTNGYAAYGSQYSSAYTSYRYYPTMYEKEKNRVINGSKVTTGLELSQQTSLISRTESSATNGFKLASSSIRPYQTYYDTSNYSTTQGLLDSSKISALLPNGSSTTYWIASRCVYLVNNSECGFGVRFVYNGAMDASAMWISSYYADTNSRALFPVVSLNARVLNMRSEGNFEVE